MSETVKARVSPASLKAAAEKYAERDGVSLNQFIFVALAEKVGTQGAAAFFAEHGTGGAKAAAPNVAPDALDAMD